MSDNKMGGVPDETCSALYRMLEKIDIHNDKQWADAIKRLTDLGPDLALRRMEG